MLKLLKYEFRKTQTMKLILLGVTAVAEVLFLVGLFGNIEKALLIGFLVLFMAAALGELVIGLQSVIALHRDMNTKQGYMLFMTPHSSCTILGAKVLECSLSVLLTGAFYLVLALLNVRLIVGRTGSAEAVMEYIRAFIHTFNASIPLDFSGISSIVFMLLCSWIRVVTTIFLADVIASSLLNGRRGVGFICFLIFIALNILLSLIAGLIPEPASVLTLMLTDGGINLVFAVIMYIVTFSLMDRYLSV